MKKMRRANSGARTVAASIWMLALMLSGAFAADRLLGLAVADHPKRPYDQGAAIADAMGAKYAVIPLAWDFVETSPGIYAPQTDWLEIAALVYPAMGWKVAVELNPIDTVADRRPKWLAGKSWDDPELVAAFQKMVGEVVSRSDKLDLVSLTLGNEVDALIGQDEVTARSYAPGARRPKPFARRCPSASRQRSRALAEKQGETLNFSTRRPMSSC
jgi:hypothetical protein